MRFENNTIGTIEATTEDDIRRAFENRESWDNADWAGNVYTLIAADGAHLSSISGPDFRDYTLAFTTADGTTRQRRRALLPAADVVDRFLRFYRGERDWLDEQAWDLPD